LRAGYLVKSTINAELSLDRDFDLFLSKDYLLTNLSVLILET
jgi:hypothetical protein